MKTRFLSTTAAVGLCCLYWVSASSTVRAADEPKAEQSLRLQNEQLGLVFDRKTGTLTVIENKLTGETYQVQGDEFQIEAVEFRLPFADVKLTGLVVKNNTLKTDYQSNNLAIEVCYTLRGHFVEKQLTLTCQRKCGLKHITVSRPAFSGPETEIVEYRYPRVRRRPGEEANCTFFGRTAKGGFFTGLEIPFDASSRKGNQVTLGFQPSLKMAEGERLACEPAYLGVYHRGSRDDNARGPECPSARYDVTPWIAPHEALYRGAVFPLRSESEAMLEMTSTVLGPPRFGLVPMVCGWHSDMETLGFTEASVKGDMRSLDFIAECGIDWVSDSHPWGGETEKMNALGENDKYELGPLVREFLEHAKKRGIKVMMWPTMNHTHPWIYYAARPEKGVKDISSPFLADRPEWRMPARPDDKRNNGNCMGCKPFANWLTRINLEAMSTGYYKSWVMDGTFFGTSGGRGVVPVDCRSDNHDHLPGNSNYACQRALAQLVESVRKQYPDTYIEMCRPAQELGIWAMRNVDACFTVFEGGTKTSLMGGDQIRSWSRARVLRDFLPHYIDQPLLFPNRDPWHRNDPRNWPSENLDYIMLSALSCSPNQLFFMPTKTGIPDKDKAEIRKWLDWGRKNVEYLKVRKDLPDWPAAGKVDGSAHLVGERGIVFLFNSGKTPLTGEFTLSEESIGLKGNGSYRITQEYPQSDRTVTATHGQTVRWEVLSQTAMILRLQKAE